MSDKTKEVTIPRWLYDSLSSDSELVRHLAHHRGQGWINIVRAEMESEKKYKLGAFKEVKNGRN